MLRRTTASSVAFGPARTVAVSCSRSRHSASTAGNHSASLNPEYVQMPDSQSIALVGLSGVGKSSVGQLLAARLGWPLLDTDALIAETVARLDALRAARAGLYAEVAHARVNVADRAIDQICAQVLQLFLAVGRGAAAPNR